MNEVQQKAATEEQKRMQILKRIQEYDALMAQAFRDQQASMDSGTLDPIQLQSFPHFILRLKQNRAQEVIALQMQERRLQVVREELKQAHIRKKSLDILKDKDFTQYRKAIEKAEEEFLAELALTRSQRPGPLR